MEELRKITEEELKDILESHEKWLKSEHKVGERANLSETDLRQANLRRTVLREAIFTRANLAGADLCWADLSLAHLRRADLRDANMVEANLCKANLRFANLSWADLRGTDMRMADLRWAILYGVDLHTAQLNDANLEEADLRKASVRDADLTNANLRGTDFCDAVLDDARYFVPSVCPKEGSFIAWKKAMNSKCDSYAYVIIKLLVPEDALRSSGISRKCRASKAVVLDIQTLEGESLKDVTAYSSYNFGFIYEIGKTVEPDSFDENRFNECSNGIHFFVDRQEAVDYIMQRREKQQ